MNTLTTSIIDFHAPVESLREIAPTPHKYASLGKFRAVVVRDFDSGRIAMVRNPIGIYVGAHGVTVKATDPSNTVRMSRNADITHTEV